MRQGRTSRDDNKKHVTFNSILKNFFPSIDSNIIDL